MNRLHVFLFLLVLSCNSNDLIIWKIKLISHDEGYTISNSLSTSSIDTFIIFDFKSFSQSCPEKDSTRSGTILIENKDGKIRDYSTFFFEENEVKDIYEDDCMYSWTKKIDLKRGIPITFDVQVTYLSDMKVTSKDTEVRFHYFYQRFPSEGLIDWHVYHLTSNWINLE